MPPADVPAGHPVHLEVLCQVILPGEEVVVTVELCMLDPVCTVPGIGKAEGSCGFIQVLSFVKGEGQETQDECFWHSEARGLFITLIQSFGLEFISIIMVGIYHMKPI